MREGLDFGRKEGRVGENDVKDDPRFGPESLERRQGSRFGGDQELCFKKILKELYLPVF